MYYYYYYGGELDNSLKLKLTISSNSKEPILWRDLNEFTSVLNELHRYIILVTQEQYAMDEDQRNLDQEIFLWHELSIEEIKRENPIIFDLIISHLTNPESYLLLIRYLFHGCFKYNNKSEDLKANLINIQNELEKLMKHLGVTPDKIISGTMYSQIKAKVKLLFKDKDFISIYNRFCKISFVIKELKSKNDDQSKEIDLLK
jgi:hypothetical protein